MNVNEVEAAVIEALANEKAPDRRWREDERPFCIWNYKGRKVKRNKVKAGTRLHFALLDATPNTEQEFQQDRATCIKWLEKVQAALDKKFKGLVAEAGHAQAYPQSNPYFVIFVTVPQ